MRRRVTIAAAAAAADAAAMYKHTLKLRFHHVTQRSSTHSTRHLCVWNRTMLF